MLRYLTAGESHGNELVGILEGLPSNLEVKIDFINSELKRRQKGYGRGKRMSIELDRLNILSGLSQGKTTGGPIAASIVNKGNKLELPPVRSPRPGHADLAGLLKYNQEEARNILERASARETAMRVGLGAICKLFLLEFDIKIISHLVQVGSAKSNLDYYNSDIFKKEDYIRKSEMNAIDKATEDMFIDEVKRVELRKDSLGGILEIVARGLPVGLGSHISYDRRLDSIISRSLMSIPAMKGIDFGLGFRGAEILGSDYHDQIVYKEKFKRLTNHAGGIEGGMSNGEDLVIRLVMKPIPTLKKGLGTVDIDSKEKTEALVERSDTCALPSASIVAENMLAMTIAKEFLNKFGGDSMEEIKDNYASYMKRVDGR